MDYQGQVSIPVLSVTVDELQAISESHQQQTLTEKQIEQIVNRLQEILQDNCLWQRQIKVCIEEIVLQSAFEQWLLKMGNSLWAEANVGVEDLPPYDYYALFMSGTAPKQAATAVLGEVNYEQ